MALDLDLSKAPDYTLCTFTNAGTICASPGQGTINLSWRRLNLFSSHSVDNLIQSYPGARYQVSATGDTSSASVQGTIFGTTLAHYNAGIGSQRQASHSVFIPCTESLALSTPIGKANDRYSSRPSLFMRC